MQTTNTESNPIDVTVYVDGTVCLFMGQTPAGETWLDEHLEEGPMMGRAYAVETRYAPAIVDGMCKAGMRITMRRGQ